MLSNFHKTTSKHRWSRKSLKGSPISSKGGRTKYKRQKLRQNLGTETHPGYSLFFPPRFTRNLLKETCLILPIQWVRTFPMHCLCVSYSSSYCNNVCVVSLLDIKFLEAMRVCMLSHFSRRLFATLWTQWSGLPCPSPGDLPNTRIILTSLTCACINRQVLDTSAT